MWLQILINSTLAMAPIWFGVVTANAVSVRFKFNDVVLLAVGVTVVGASGYVGFLLSWLAYVLDTPVLIPVLRIALLSLMLVLLMKYKLSRPILELMVLCHLITLVAVATALCRGIADTAQGIQHTIAVRYWNSIDNQIPGIFAKGLEHKLRLRPEILDGWQSSDRPPVATGLIRIFSPFTHSLHPDFFILVASSSVLIISTVATVRLIWNRKDMEIAISIATVFCPGIFVNVVYTWPKIIAASLSLVAILILFQLKNRNDVRTSEIYFSIFAMVLALLSHGSSVFALPPFAILFLIVVWRQKVHLFAIPFAVFAYLPWLGYQRYWDPPGNRLVYWHLAGELGGGGGSILQSIWGKYRDLRLTEILANKLHNFEAIFIRVDGNPAVSGYSGIFGSYQQLVSESVIGSLGVVGWLGLLVLLIIGIRGIDRNQRIFVWLFLSTVVPFCLIEFGDSFSTRSSLVVSPMVLSIGLSIVGSAMLILFLRVNPKLIVLVSFINIALLGPMQPTAAAAGWGLAYWDLQTCVLLVVSGLSLASFAFWQLNSIRRQSVLNKFPVI